MGLPSTSLNKPNNGSTIVVAWLEITYQDSTDGLTASSVTIEVDTVNTFSSGNKKTSVFSSVPSGTTLGARFLLADGLYYWRVISVNATGTTTSSTQTFTTAWETKRTLYTVANIAKKLEQKNRALYSIANVARKLEVKRRGLYTITNVGKKFDELKRRALYEYENITDDPPWPTIFTLSGTRFSKGAELTILGSGFGFSTADDPLNEDRFKRSYDGTVMFNGIPANIISWSWTKIVITLPSDAESASIFVRLSKPTVRDSNKVGVEIYEAEISDSIGIEFFLCDHKAPNTILKQLGFAKEKSFQNLLNAPGSGQFSIDLDEAEGIKDKMTVLCRLDGVDVQKWIIEDVEPVLADPSENPTLRCSGRGVMALLERGAVYPTSMQGKTDRVWEGVYGGDIFRQLILEAQKRGAIPYVHIDWEPGYDSIGNPWDDDTSISLHVGTPLLQVADKLANGLGLFDVEMTPNLRLRIYKKRGKDMSDEVRYELGQAILEHSAPSQSGELVNVLLIEGENGAMIEVSDPTSPATWGRHEGYLQSRTIPEHWGLDTYGRHYLEQSADPRRSIIGRVAKFVYEDGRKLKPFETYILGDWISWYVNEKLEKVRVKGITVEEDTETGEPSYTLDLNNILLERQIKMNQQLSRVSMNSADSPLTSTGDKPPLTEMPPHNHSHTTLTDLDNDDHPQYLNEQRHSEVDHSMIVYTLPQATATVLGGVKAKAKTTESGEVAIDGTTGKLYAPTGGGSYTLPQATGSTLGGVKAKAKTSETGEVAIDGTTGKLFAPESSYSLPQADATTLGGIKAKAKTSETIEVAIEGATGKLFVPAPDEAANGIPAGGTAGQILSKVNSTDYNTQWVDNPSAFSVAVAGGYSGTEEDFEADLASIEGLAAAIAAIVGV